MNDNNLTVEVYSSGLVHVVDISRELERAQDLQFNTGYPGGLYLDASFFVPRDITMPWGLRGGQRVVFRNGLVVVYEGFIASFDYIDSGDVQGIRVNCEGGYARYLMQRRWNKIWSDTRTDERTWKFDETSSKAEIWEMDRNDRIYISAKGATFASGSADDCYIQYDAPAGHTIARMTYDWTVNEYSGRNFGMLVQEYNSSDGWVDIAASIKGATGTGQLDLTPTAGTTALRLVAYSAASQTVTADERNLVAWTKLCVYSETGTIDLPAVAADCLGYLTELNSTDIYISPLASALSLCGTSDAPSSFGAFDDESIADILAKAASFGDGNNDRHAVGLRRSDLAPTPDGKPVIFVEKYPALTSWDVSVRLDDFNLASGIEIKEKYNEIYNYVIVRYNDDNGFSVRVTPTDDASLTDASSVAAYGRRDYVLDVGYCNSATAIKNGKRFLAAHKDPQFELSSPVTVMGRIRTLSGEFIPCSQVAAGTRLKVENWLNDLTGTGQGVTFLVSSTHYDDAAETLTLTAGPPPDLIFPQMVKPGQAEAIELWQETRPTPDMIGGGAGEDYKSRKYVKGKPGAATKEAWEKGLLKPQKGKK